MSVSLPLFFVEPALLPQHPLLAHAFTPSPQSHEQLALSLYTEGIAVQLQDSTLRWLPFDFEVKFTLLRNKLDTSAKDSIGEPYGLKFERAPGQGELTLYNKSRDVLIKWRDELSKLVNQRGFHDLYKPYRRIGKGNSATVHCS